MEFDILSNKTQNKHMFNEAFHRPILSYLESLFIHRIDFHFLYLHVILIILQAWLFTLKSISKSIEIAYEMLYIRKSMRTEQHEFLKWILRWIFIGKAIHVKE